MKKLGERRDIIKQIHRALRGGDLTRFNPVRPGQGLPHGRGGIEERELVGRVAKNGFGNELKATLPYAHGVLRAPWRPGGGVPRDGRARRLPNAARLRRASRRPTHRGGAGAQGASTRSPATEVWGVAKDAATRTAPARLRELAGLGLVTAQGPGRWAVPLDLLEKVAKRSPEKVRYRFSVDPLPLSLGAQVQHRGTRGSTPWTPGCSGERGSGPRFGALEHRREFVERELGTDPGGPQRGAEILERNRRARGRTIQKNIG